jgi:hypothetical protein
MRFTKGEKAYIICHDAVCRYDPHEESPARVIPPKGTEIHIIDDIGQWILIEFVGKRAWCRSDFLTSENINIPKDPFDIKPYIVSGRPILYEISRSQYDPVEYGPRGGRFTRTRSGHRRYF